VLVFLLVRTDRSISRPRRRTAKGILLAYSQRRVEFFKPSLLEKRQNRFFFCMVVSDYFFFPYKFGSAKRFMGTRTRRGVRDQAQLPCSKIYLVPRARYGDNVLAGR
jgi:hypothetical protein